MTDTALSRGATAVLHRLLASPIAGTTMLSPAGVWLLLATAASGAVGTARDELTAVTGEVTPELLEAAVRGLGGTGAAAALGAWAGPDHTVRRDWSERVGRLSSGPIPDKSALDRWAAATTDGLIDSFPLQPDPESVLVLASALAARSSWEKEFTDHKGWLHRSTHRSHSPVLRSTDGRTLAAVVHTEGRELEVLLAIGAPGTPPHEVLSDLAGELVEVPAGAERRLPGWVSSTRSAFPATAIDLHAFDLSHRLDLGSDTARWGLAALSDRTETENLLAGLLSGTVPVLLTDAVSVSRMQFDAKGFAAGSVSAMAFMAGSMPPSNPKEVLLRFDLREQPFGVLVRTTTDRTPLFVGWIAPDRDRTSARPRS